jgi:hypothetical protein
VDAIGDDVAVVILQLNESISFMVYCETQDWRPGPGARPVGPELTMPALVAIQRELS